ncbi:hypothetical protein [Streptomyces sp. NPDC051546]
MTDKDEEAVSVAGDKTVDEVDERLLDQAGASWVAHSVRAGSCRR